MSKIEISELQGLSHKLLNMIAPAVEKELVGELKDAVALAQKYSDKAIACKQKLKEFYELAIATDIMDSPNIDLDSFEIPEDR